MNDKMSVKVSDKRLLPCPCCKGKAEIVYFHDCIEDYYKGYIRCKDCGIQTKELDFGSIYGESTQYHLNPLETLIEIWNARKPLERIVGKLEDASYMTECTFDEDGWSNNDNYEVVLLDKVIEIVKEEMG